MLDDPKFLFEELKTMFDEYLVNVDNTSKDEYYGTEYDRAKSVLYDFLFHIKEMTPEYKKLIEQLEDLNIQLMEVKRKLDYEKTV